MISNHSRYQEGFLFIGNCVFRAIAINFLLILTQTSGIKQQAALCVTETHIGENSVISVDFNEHI